MDQANKIKQLRERTGLNRREFCEYFNIPYRTVTDWERGERHAPDYVVRLLEYYVRMKKMIAKDDDNAFEGEKQYEIKELRERTGMNRKEFCEHYDISYRTVTDWERKERHAPDYVVRLLEYNIRMEKSKKKD